MIDIIQNTVDGVMIGSSYALLALGFTLIFGTMRRLNLAYGPTIMAGAYLGTYAFLALDIGVLPVALLVVAGAAVAGLYVERLCFRPFGEGAAIASMISSFAVWMQIEEAASLALPHHLNAFPRLVSGQPITVGPFFFRLDHLAMLAVAAAAAALVHVVLHRTRFGLGVRTLIDHRRAAELVGVPVTHTLTLAFLLACAIGGLAGFLIAASEAQITPMFGMWATTKGLIAMMIGGLGSVPGAIMGGLALGVIEAQAQWLFGPQVRDLIAWGVLFAVLALWPGGLLGGRQVAEQQAVQRRV
ncbi:MAG: branched-chain amino acid ABC transporter permease [Hyphomicrobiaceae bacterium]|nr:MAG: branched-chain amino acid ABC transporter permease [Hyphomicrobiaceae bacterium]